MRVVEEVLDQVKVEAGPCEPVLASLLVARGKGNDELDDVLRGLLPLEDRKAVMEAFEKLRCELAGMMFLEMAELLYLPGVRGGGSEKFLLSDFLICL